MSYNLTSIHRPIYCRALKKTYKQIDRQRNQLQRPLYRCTDGTPGGAGQYIHEMRSTQGLNIGQGGCIT